MTTNLFHLDSSYQEALKSIAAALSSANKVVVIVGAGVSTAANIPDFRSKDGLYESGDIFSLDALSRPGGKARLLSVALQLRKRATQAEPTATHHFIRTLRDRGQLLRCYTQNIDMLEEKVGLHTDIDPRADCIPLHGSLSHLRCQLCRKTFDWDGYEVSIHSADDIPCPHCLLVRQERMRKSLRPTSIGCLLPDITLLDESHSNGEAIAEIINGDAAAAPDVLLVLGTSLRVAGPKMLARMFARVVGRWGGIVVYTNLSQPPLSWRRLADFVVDRACDTWATDLERVSVSARASLMPHIEKARKQQPKRRRQSERGRTKRGSDQRLGRARKQDGSAECPIILD